MSFWILDLKTFNRPSFVPRIFISSHRVFAFFVFLANYLSSLLVAGDLVVTMDSARRVLKDGGVYVEGNTIVDVGPSAEIKAKYKPDRIFGGRRRLVMPGFVNAHDHYSGHLIRQLGDDRDLFTWLEEMVMPLSIVTKPEDIYIGAKACMAEQIKSGITTVFDDSVVWLPNHISKRASVDDIAKASTELGIRIIEAVGGADHQEEVSDIFRYDAEAAKKDCSSLFQKYNKADSMVRIWSNASWPPVCTDEMFRAMKQVADEYGTGTYSHVAESLKEVQLMKRRTGKTEIEYLDSIGFLGNNVLFAHAVWLTESDMARLKRNETKISHQPICNQYLASGIAAVPRLMKEGITVGLGIDDGGHANEDFFALMKTYCLIHKGVLLDATCTTAEKALEMATIDGARALGMDRSIGSLEPGKKADIIVVNEGRLNYSPHTRPLTALVYGGMATDIETTIIDGRVVVDQGNITAKIDEEELMNQAERRAYDLVERADKKSLVIESHRGWAIPYMKPSEPRLA